MAVATEAGRSGLGDSLYGEKGNSTAQASDINCTVMQVRGIAGLLLLTCAIRAQGPTAEITGVVTDSSGGVVTGAPIVIKHPATGLQRTVITNAAGIYTAPALSPGTYSVSVNMSGFRSEVRNNVELQVNQIARTDFSLQLGNVSEV